LSFLLILLIFELFAFICLIRSMRVPVAGHLLSKRVATRPKRIFRIFITQAFCTLILFQKVIKMRIFPLATKVDSYKTNYSCRFGAPRDGGRKHGGCDLAAAAGTPVYAVDDGVVIEAAGGFDKYGTCVISIEHGDFYDDDYCIIRYGEVDTMLVQVGSKVTKGQMIAKVGKQPGGTQLHLEMYSGIGAGQFKQENSLPYKRRSDLIDPTPHLDSWPVKP
jgi:murein DD-endopeptidase MepM/ murein hydrolase activator NlpD